MQSEHLLVFLAGANSVVANQGCPVYRGLHAQEATDLAEGILCEKGNRS